MTLALQRGSLFVLLVVASLGCAAAGTPSNSGGRAHEYRSHEVLRAATLEHWLSEGQLEAGWLSSHYPQRAREYCGCSSYVSALQSVGIFDLPSAANRAPDRASVFDVCVVDGSPRNEMPLLTDDGERDVSFAQMSAQLITWLPAACASPQDQLGAYLALSDIEARWFMDYARMVALEQCLVGGSRQTTMRCDPERRNAYIRCQELAERVGRDLPQQLLTAPAAVGDVAPAPELADDPDFSVPQPSDVGVSPLTRGCVRALQAHVEEREARQRRQRPKKKRPSVGSPVFPS